MLPNDIHNAYLTVNRGGKESLHPAGRFMIVDGKLSHLEDHHGLLEKEIPEGQVDDFIIAKLAHPGSGLKVASRGAIRAGHRPDCIPEAQLSPLPPGMHPASPKPVQPHVEVKPPSVFHYTRAGHDQPHVLEVKDGVHLLDGNPLSHQEVATILDNVRTKAAKIRYIKGVRSDAIAKMEQVFENLRKGEEDMDPQAALAHLVSLHGTGDDKTNSAIAALRRHVFEDQMVPGLGNKYAFKQFQAQNTPGTSVVGDANFFKQINDVHGHQAGDDAIKAMGNAWKDAAAEVGEGKAHRFGGDEFHVQFPTPEHAAKFARNLRSKLEAMPPVGGTHRIGMSLGIGDSFHGADQALYEAKKGKLGHTPATVPHVLAHSLHPSSPGPVPVEPSIQPPQIEHREPAPAPIKHVAPVSAAR